MINELNLTPSLNAIFFVISAVVLLVMIFIQTIIASRQGQTEHRYEVLKSISFFISSQSEELNTTNWSHFISLSKIWTSGGFETFQFELIRPSDGRIAQKNSLPTCNHTMNSKQTKKHLLNKVIQ